MARGPAALAAAVWLVALTRQAGGCVINGYDSGICLEDWETMPYEARTNIMPFCGRFIDYSVCVPEPQELPADRNFPFGRFKNHTMAAKDAWIKSMAHGNIRWRVDLETNKKKQKNKKNEWGEDKEIIPRFYQNRDCKMAYIRLMCWANFPRCDPHGTSLMVCETACKNFFKSCQYDEKLWRCGPSEDFNKILEDKNQKEHTVDITDGSNPKGVPHPKANYDAPEVPAGQKYYLPDFFPGQPFAQEHCTGAAVSAARPPHLLVWAACAACSVALSMMMVRR